MQHNQKGFILLESLMTLFAFTIVLFSFFPIYQHILKQRDEREQFFQAFLLARTEMHNVSKDPRSKILLKYPFTVYVETTPFNDSIIELNVLVQWEGRRGELKNIYLKKLIFFSENLTSG